MLQASTSDYTSQIDPAAKRVSCGLLGLVAVNGECSTLGLSCGSGTRGVSIGTLTYACALCPAGMLQLGWCWPVARACTRLCGLAYRTPPPNLAACVAAGSYSTGSVTSCTACGTGKAAGSVGGTSSSACVDCAAGTYASSTGAPVRLALLLCLRTRHLQRRSAPKHSSS